ncbi:MAG: pyridoxal-dependent decarboxylase [Planctomycetota bacterium]
MNAGDVYAPEVFRRVVERFTDAVAEYLAATGDRRVAVTDAVGPEQVAALVDEPLPRIGRGVECAGDELLDVFLGHANRLAHPRYIGHQVAPPLPLAAAVDLVSSALNNGAAIWEMSPAGTVIEHRVLAWFAELVGWRWPVAPGAEGAGGSFVDGGTLSNLTALAAARARAYPDAWESGYDPSGAAIVCAETAHYCVERAAGVFGLGRSGLFGGKTRAGRFEPDEARRACKRARAAGRRPFALVACAGSTAVGAVDDLVALAEVAREEGAWFHVDAAHGGAFLVSDELRACLVGLELADSVTIDLHKMLFQPISTAMVLVRDARSLRAAFQQEASYVFHPRADGPVWDQGPHSFQCSRRVDAVRAWTSLIAYGADGLGRLQETCVDTARAAARTISASADFELALVPDTNIVCFRHVPPGLSAAALDAHNAALREGINRGRQAFLTATTFEGARWLRFTFINPRTTLDDVRAVLELVRAAARDAAPAGR